MDIALKTLHDRKFVFGDLRSPNILVHREEGMLRVKLVDFAWCGLVGRSRYPPNLNTELAWPRGVKPGGLIAFEHDLEALHRIS